MHPSVRLKIDFGFAKQQSRAGPGIEDMDRRHGQALNFAQFGYDEPFGVELLMLFSFNHLSEAEGLPHVPLSLSNVVPDAIQFAHH